MPQVEKTNNRPKNYSGWHRYPTLPKWCCMTDGDFFEQRRIGGFLTSVAYIETIQIDNPHEGNMTHIPWGSKIALMFEIEEKMKIPAYAVWHNEECSKFLVQQVSSNEPKKMNEEEYKNFLMGLGICLSNFFSR